MVKIMMDLWRRREGYSETNLRAKTIYILEGEESAIINHSNHAVKQTVKSATTAWQTVIVGGRVRAPVP